MLRNGQAGPAVTRPRGPSLPVPPRGTARGENVTRILVFWGTPERQNITMLGPDTGLYGVKWLSGVVRRRRPAPGRPGLTLDAVGGPPWARF